MVLSLLSSVLKILLAILFGVEKQKLNTETNIITVITENQQRKIMHLSKKLHVQIKTESNVTYVKFQINNNVINSEVQSILNYCDLIIMNLSA